MIATFLTGAAETITIVITAIKIAVIITGVIKPAPVNYIPRMM